MVVIKLLDRNEPNVTENRHLYVGGSDVPVILGLSKFKTQYELAQNKTGIVKSDFKGNEYTAFGHALEPQVREFINLTTDYNFVETSTIDNKHRIRANTDGVDYDKKTLLEIKTHGANPTMDVYKVQMQLYMFANDLDQGLLALYHRPSDFNLEFDSNRLKTVMIKRDDDLIEHILKEIELFWKRVDWLSQNKNASEWEYNTCIPEHKIKGGSKPVSKELEVRTVKLKPAEVEFNFEEIEKELETRLKKYKGLTFTEVQATECRNTIAELRKVKNGINRFRIDTKKKLTEPITVFEDKCKALVTKIDEAVKPLSEQLQEFDERQRQEKLQKVEQIKQQVIEDLQLVEEVANELVIEDRFLNKSTTLKSIEEALHEQANEIILQKQNEAQTKQLIEQHVEIVNLKNELDLVASSYVHLINHKEIDEIKEIIDQDAKELIEKQEKEKRIETAERMQERIKQQEQEEQQETEEQFIEVYEVVGTEEQLDRLEEFMKENNMSFKILED